MEGLETPKLALKMTPLPHQERVADKLEGGGPGQLAYHGLGSGKTLSAINAAHQMHAPFLAIVPASLRENMRKEITRSGFKLPSMVMSYEEARKKMDDPEFKSFAENAVVAYDEAHRTGRSESFRSKIPAALASHRKIFLTGSPIRNHPVEVAPMINAIAPGSLPANEKDFNKYFIETTEHPVGYWGKLRGAKPGRTHKPVNLKWFEEAVKGKVDYHENVDRSEFPSFSESVIDVPMSAKQQATYNFVMGKYPALAYKVWHGIPPSKKETKDFQSFATGPRQVSNHPMPFNRSAKDTDSAKVQKIGDEVEQRWKRDKNYRGVTFSTYVESGIDPISRELTRRGVPHATFTGDMNDEQRKKVITDYNAGKVPHLLISGAGAEGLDLKGTKLMQITEPHWNEELINQVRGRAIRYKSHTHLPEKERHVEVQRFHSVPRPGVVGRMFGHTRAKGKGIDEYLHGIAKEKQRLNQPFLEVLKGRPAEEVQKEWDSQAAPKTAAAAATQAAQDFAGITFGCYFHGEVCLEDDCHAAR